MSSPDAYGKVTDQFSLDAALDTKEGERYAWAAHYLGEMGKAVIDDLTQGMLRKA